MQTVFATPCLDIYLHEGAFPVIELHWLGYAPGQQFREAILRALELAATHRAQGWISDDRDLGAVRPRDLDWAFETAMPCLNELGLSRFAQLESQDALNRRTIEGAYQQHETAMLPFALRRFTDLTEARAWVLGLDSNA